MTEMFERSDRWDVAIGAALILAGSGLWVGSPTLLIAAMAPVGFVAYSALSSAPNVETALRCRRTIIPQQTYAGEPVVVKLTVENESDRLLADIRLVDGVPDELAVISGSPRAGATLGPGDTVTVEYTLRARYGTFEFGSVQASAHSLSAESSFRTALGVDGDRSLRAMYEPENYPLAERTLPITGSLLADRGSEGLEFHSIRPYQPGDPASRINWRQYARERVLSTVEYRPEEATEVLVIVDGRPSAGCASNQMAPTGTELCVSLTADLVDSLLADRNRVGLLALGVEETADRSLSWVPPANSQRSRTEIEQLLDATAATVRPGADRRETGHFDIEPVRIIDRLNRRTQVLVVSPFVDSYPVDVVRQLTATGHAVSVYSPAVRSSTAGGQLEASQRALRLRDLRKQGISVVDWQPDEPLAVAFNRSHTERSQRSQ